jgi:hypothetical protein
MNEQQLKTQLESWLSFASQITALNEEIWDTKNHLIKSSQVILNKLNNAPENEERETFY